MSETTAIEWCDSTFNPWIGCTRVSTAATGGGGCDHCYAAVSTPARAMKIEWASGAPRHRTAPGTWKQPLQWERAHEAFFVEHGRRRRVFCASLADVFDNEVDPAWRRDLFDLIRATPNLDWLLLTKRIGNARGMAPAEWFELDGWPAHVRVGSTVVNQAEYQRDWSKLFALGCPNFLSIEPMLGPIVFGNEPRPDWVVTGGESGVRARPANPKWFRSLRDQCATAGVPFLFKQWGEWTHARSAPAQTPGRYALAPREFDGPIHEIDHYPRQFNAFGSTVLERIGKKAAGRLLDGVEHNGFPEVACAR